MVIKPLSFHRHLVGPYGLFSDQSGNFIVGREVKVSSPSSEVLSVISVAPRFSSVGEALGVSFANIDADIPVAQVKEYVEIECIDFDYGHVGMMYSSVDHLSIAGAVFCSTMKMFGGWKEFYREVLRNGGGMSLQWDEDGIDYERIIDYTVRLTMTGGVAERLIKSEGYRLW